MAYILSAVIYLTCISQKTKLDARKIFDLMLQNKAEAGHSATLLRAASGLPVVVAPATWLLPVFYL